MVRPGTLGVVLTLMCLVAAATSCIAQMQIVQDVHVTSTDHGDIGIAATVSRTVSGGQVVDTYSFTVSNLSFQVNGGGICWFGVPNPQALPAATVPVQTPPSWAFTLAWPSAGGAQGWYWSAPAGGPGIAVGDAATFGFSVSGPTSNVARQVEIGWCNTPSPSSVAATTIGPSVIDLPDIVLDQGVGARCSCDGSTCTMTVFALIHNNGPANVPAGFNVSLTTPYGDHIAPITYGLAAGRQVPLIWSWSFSCPASGGCFCPNDFSIAVGADSDHAITESDETNNAIGLQVCCDPIAAPNLKALLVEAPACLCDGNGYLAYGVTIDLWNTGTLDVPPGSPGFSVLVHWPFSSADDVFVVTQGLPAGSHLAFSGCHTGFALAGPCPGTALPVVATADTLDQVNEGDENDNTAVRPFDCAPRPEMTLIPGGSFAMGDSFGDGDPSEQPVHAVYVSGFFMDKYEVTKALWDEVAACAGALGYDIGPVDADGKAADHPAYNVTWYEAVKWANARSERGLLTPCYTVGGSVYRTGESDPACDWSANGYRLPTEAEWEKAARGGVAGHRFPWSDVDTIQQTRANYRSPGTVPYDTSSTSGFHSGYANGSWPYTSPAGSFAPNGYGLFDMAGNVVEWCWDRFGSQYYASSPGIDPRGPTSGSYRVGRDGSWSHYPQSCRVADRTDLWPSNGDVYFGFRLVRRAP